MTQSEAFDILKMGCNVFLTGSAGSGKTHLLNQYIAYLKERRVDVAVTASTGIAATHIGGVTIHSWSGIGIKDNLAARDIDALEQRKYLWKRFEKTKVLIIDEISMLDTKRFDMVDKVLKTFKRNMKPFGGMQVVLCGDLFQLPPVKRGERSDEPPVFGSLTPGDPSLRHWADQCDSGSCPPNMRGPSGFACQSGAWEELSPRICYLKEQHRHNDSELLDVLNEIRANAVNESTMNKLRGRYKKEPEGRIQPTKLYTHNIDVDRINSKELDKISGKQYSYEMKSSGRKPLVESLKKSCLSPEELILKKGARVMFVKNNYEKGYVNGTLGEVIDFSYNDYPLVKTYNGEKIIAEPESWRVEEEGKVKAEITQIPLRLAWAITVHKSQGMSLDAAEVDLSKAFERGQGYVALSRLRSLSGLKLLGLNKTALLVDDDILDLDKKLLSESEKERKHIKFMDEAEKQKRQRKFIILSGGLIEPKKGSLSTPRRVKESTYEKTKKLLDKRLSIADIAKERGLTQSTVISHIEKLLDDGKLSAAEIGYLKPKTKSFYKSFLKIKSAFEESGDTKLAPVRRLLKNTVSYDDLRFARLFLKK